MYFLFIESDTVFFLLISWMMTFIILISYYIHLFLYNIPVNYPCDISVSLKLYNFFHFIIIYFFLQPLLSISLRYNNFLWISIFMLVRNSWFLHQLFTNNISWSLISCDLYIYMYVCVCIMCMLQKAESIFWKNITMFVYSCLFPSFYFNKLRM